MTNKERAEQLLANIPDHKLPYIINILEDVQAYAGEAIPPDDWDLEMLSEIENNSECKEFISCEEAMKELGIDLERTCQ